MTLNWPSFSEPKWQKSVCYSRTDSLSIWRTKKVSIIPGRIVSDWDWVLNSLSKWKKIPPNCQEKPKWPSFEGKKVSVQIAAKTAFIWRESLRRKSLHLSWIFGQNGLHLDASQVAKSIFENPNCQVIKLKWLEVISFCVQICTLAFSKWPLIWNQVVFSPCGSQLHL